MPLTLLKPHGYPVETIGIRENIPLLYRERKWSILAMTHICKDHNDNIISYYGDMEWDCSPFSHVRGTLENQRIFYFNYLASNEALLQQAKLIAYGWLYFKGHKNGKACKLSTLAIRFNLDIKPIFLFLMLKGYESLVSLSNPKVWLEFENYIKEKNLSLRAIKFIIMGLFAINRLERWSLISIDLPNVKQAELAKKLADINKLESQQTLAIPQTITDILYGEALEMVNTVWPFRHKLVQLERELYENYSIGKDIVDAKIKSGRWSWLVNSKGLLLKRKYHEEVSKAIPRSFKSIINIHLSDTNILPAFGADGNWLREWRGKLQTACFICCGAFTGMRVSELLELQSDSFYMREIEGKMFPLVRAATHKLAAGHKKEEWLASPIVEKAIDVATALIAFQKEEMLIIAENVQDTIIADRLRRDSNCIWLTLHVRNHIPGVIAGNAWNGRLQLFAKQTNAIINKEALYECHRLNPLANGAINSRIKLGCYWHFTTHQFRRTFAVFAIRHHLGHALALKQQFKHLYLRMSEWYSNGAMQARLDEIQIDNELQQLIDIASIESSAADYNRWFNGDEKISGGFGKAIIAMREDKPIIYSSWDNIYKLVKEHRLTLHGTLHSYCKNGYECKMDGIVNPAFCIECSGSIIDRDKALWWEKRHQSLTHYLAKKKDVSLGEYSHCITQIRAAESVMKDFNIEFDRYQHHIEVINL